MFEPISQNLTQLMMFAILGFALGGLYEPIRINRLFIKTGTAAVAIEDFLFLALCGVIVFAYSLELGSGEFRLFYLAGLGFGGVVYFITLGRVVSLVTRTFANAIKAAVRFAFSVIKRRILLPSRDLLVKLIQKSNTKIITMYKITEKHASLLQNNIKMKYNNKVSQLGRKRRSPRLVKGETRNVIKAKVKKI